MEVLDLSLKNIAPSPTNPRKHLGDLTELTESVKQLGVLQPIVVRPQPGPAGKYECVFGHRRLEASIRAQLAKIPAIVREYSDLEVLEAQLVENLHRSDVHPLDEADGYGALLDRHGYTVQQIADKVGQKKAQIYARLKLRSLGAKGRKAFMDGKLDASTALLVARIPVEKLQDEAVARIAGGIRRKGWRGGDPLSYRDAREVIEEEFMLRLSDAPFKTGDAALCGEAGACTVCPKRTGNQTELFSDIKSADVCTDPTCFAKKVDAHWRNRKEQAKADGQKLIHLKGWDESKLSKDGLVHLDATPYDRTPYRTYRQHLGKKPLAPSAVILVVRDGNKLEEWADKRAVLKLLPKKPAASKSVTKSGDKAKGKDAGELRERTNSAVLVAVVAAAGRLFEHADGLRPLVRSVANRLLYDGEDPEGVLSRRNLSTKGGNLEATLKKFIADASHAELEALLVELVFAEAGSDRWNTVKAGDDLAIALAETGQNLAIVVENARKAHQDEQAAKKPAPTPAKASKKKPAKKAAGRKAA